MASVTLDKVTKTYGAVRVIEALDLEIADHEFLVLVGPSGCGKSTALRMVAGLEEITSGTIRIGDREVNHLPPKDRDIAMVFQNYALYPHMTVRENLEFGLRIRRTPAAERERLVRDAAEILGLGDLLERRPRQLSGGQRQRVAVGRAMTRNPAVFLFDEPLSNLDAKLRVQMRAEITRLQQRLRTTTLYVTHDQVEAMTMGHRIAVLHAGRLQQVGTPLALYERPENLFVAQFIGTPPMNFVRVTVAEGGGRLVASGFSVEVPAPHRPVLASRDRQPVIMGLRPENVVEPGRARAASARITAHVEMVEPLGHEVIVHARAGDDPLVAKFGPHDAPAAGSRTELALELEAMHLFDPATEAALR